jgi:dTDP-glucose 4,6-dehydratase
MAKIDKPSDTILVTGGAGFIGSALVRRLIATAAGRIINVDKLTYAGNLASLGEAANDPAHVFVQADIGDRAAMAAVFAKYGPRVVFNLAAESHVDRSIDTSADFIATNIVGTHVLLECARAYWAALDEAAKKPFRFVHVSTDEVFGDLGPEGVFTEATQYAPNSPYAASKASADLLVRAWGRTYGLPVIVTNCSNNYGPCQYPEKLIPLMILNALDGSPLPVYGDGGQVRDWLYVDDHVDALLAAASDGQPGETYAIGGNAELKNIEVVKRICAVLDKKPVTKPAGVRSFGELIDFVADRPGHDRRYAIDATKIRSQLGVAPARDFADGLEATIDWYIANRDWVDKVEQKAPVRLRHGLAAK